MNIEEKLRSLGASHAGIMRLKNGQLSNYGSIRIENGHFVHYTGQGLREMWPQSGDTEKAIELRTLDELTLIRMQHIAKTPLTEIDEVIK